MKTLSLALLFGTIVASPAFAAPQTWTGTISDAMCGAKHMDGDHGMKTSEKECTEMCVSHGSKYVLVSDGKVLAIANQSLASLKTFAGDRVSVTGELKDAAVTISKIEKAK
ncbi:MAG: hypothetical protein LBQ09_10495 [Acidobacteriaceae bacterium]|jgi:hypothetical protein|nr:hypothetical protein [Acidobacteriaceae bacterium]